MAVDRFCRNGVGPPEWECEAMGMLTSAECVLNLSIAAPADMGLVRSRSHYEPTIMITCLITTLVR